MTDVLTRLGAQIDARRHSDASSSYTASLFELGEDAILKKVGEEAVEFLLAAKGDDPGHLVAEAADVWFHMLVLLSAKGLGPLDILNELQRREGVSGHVEKASRAIEETER
jgi:phosphoribosyl-ATP pyrophosphohydrolase